MFTIETIKLRTLLIPVSRLQHVTRVAESLLEVVAIAVTLSQNI